MWDFPLAIFHSQYSVHINFTQLFNIRVPYKCFLDTFLGRPTGPSLSFFHNSWECVLDETFSSP